MHLTKQADPAALQEPMGERFGVMTTLNTYMNQSFTLRRRETLRPFYPLAANIVTEQPGDIDPHSPDKAEMSAARAAMCGP